MLTSQDLSQIEKLLITLENRIIQKVDTSITTRIDLAVEQIKEYIDITLDNHEKRLRKLEDSPTYLVRDQKKLK